MTQEEKISLLEKIRLDYAFLGTPSFDVLTNAIDALKGPWVKTADRAPTRVDAQRVGHYDLIIAMWTDYKAVEVLAVGYSAVTTSPNFYPYWMPVPPIPQEKNE